MKQPFELLKSALVTGLIIILPAWLALILLVQLLLKLGVLVKPIAAQMPKGINHPQLVAAAVFILICFVVGLLVHTVVGRVIGRVHPVDVPVTTMMKCISKWGSGSAELLAARGKPAIEARH